MTGSKNRFHEIPEVVIDCKIEQSRIKKAIISSQILSIQELKSLPE